MKNLPETPKNWRIEIQNSDYKLIYKHKELPLWMIISYEQDHYDSDGNAVMRYQSSARYGTEAHDIGRITFGEIEYFVIDEDTDKETAWEDALEWATNWMKNYRRGKFDLDI